MRLFRESHVNHSQDSYLYRKTQGEYRQLRFMMSVKYNHHHYAKLSTELRRFLNMYAFVYLSAVEHDTQFYMLVALYGTALPYLLVWPFCPIPSGEVYQSCGASYP